MTTGIVVDIERFWSAQKRMSPGPGVTLGNLLAETVVAYTEYGHEQSELNFATLVGKFYQLNAQRARCLAEMFEDHERYRRLLLAAIDADAETLRELAQKKLGE